MQLLAELALVSEFKLDDLHSWQHEPGKMCMATGFIAFWSWSCLLQAR